jgi:hypothetical protein
VARTFALPGQEVVTGVAGGGVRVTQAGADDAGRAGHRRTFYTRPFRQKFSVQRHYPDGLLTGTPAHAPLLTNVPEAHAVASLSVAVVQVTAVALATGTHAAIPDTWFSIFTFPRIAEITCMPLMIQTTHHCKRRWTHNSRRCT